MMVNDERIKVLIVCGSLGVGGAEVQLSRLAPLLNRNVFDVQVAYYTSKTGFPKTILEEAGIRVTCLIGTKWKRWKFFVSAIKFMKKERFDLVHAWFNSDNHYGRLPAILTSVPVVIGGLRGNEDLQGRWPLIYSLMNFRCAGWIANSLFMKDLAARKMSFMSRSPTLIIRNGLHLDNESRTKRCEYTYYDQLKSNYPVIGIIGRLHPIKNHLLFVEMAHLLTESGLEVDYWIIGEGEMRGKIELAISRFGLKDRVKLVGYREDIEVALSRIDLAVLTSDEESCPNALLEAMRASLPVVSTKCTSLEEIIEEGCNGFTVEVGDAQGLADKVIQLLSDTEKMKQMGMYSRQIIEKRFSISSAVRELEDAYIYFLKRKSRSYPRLHKKLEKNGFLEKMQDETY